MEVPRGIATEELTELCQDQRGAHELGDVGIMPPEPCDAAGLVEAPLMEAEVAPALPALLDPVVAASPPWESDEEMTNHELGDAGITLPEPCDAAGTTEGPLMEADVAPDLPDLLDLVVAASPPRESDEEMANLQGAGVVLAPLSLPSALFSRFPGWIS